MKGRNAPGINLYGPESKTNFSRSNPTHEASALLVTKTIFTEFKCEDLEKNIGVVPASCLEAKSGLILPFCKRIAFSPRLGSCFAVLNQCFIKQLHFGNIKRLSTAVHSTGAVEDYVLKTSFIFCPVLNMST